MTYLSVLAAKLTYNHDVELETALEQLVLDLSSDSYGVSMITSMLTISELSDRRLCSDSVTSTSRLVAYTFRTLTVESDIGLSGDLLDR